MNLYSVPPFISSIIGVFLGSLVLSKNIRKKTNILFFVFCILISIWYFSLSIMLSTKNVNIYNLFTKIGLAPINIIAIPYLLFVFDILKVKNKKLILSIFLISLFTLYLLLNNQYTFKYYFTGKLIYSWGVYPKAGIGETINAVITITSIAICIIYLNFFKLKKIKQLYPRSEYIRLKYIFIAISVFGLGAIDYFPKFGLNIYPFGCFFFLIFSSITTYAILKHNLLDINIVIRRGLIYSILATLITVLYFLIVFLSENLFRGLVGYKSIPLTLTIVAIFIMLFQPLKNRIQSFVDRFFFKGTQEEITRENERLMEELGRSEKLKAVGTLAAGMAHEIKNPLSAIKTFTEYLPEKHNDPSFRSKFSKIVGGEVEKINNIVGQLLDFSKPKPLSLKEIDIHTLLDDTMNLLSNDLIKRRVNLVREYAPIKLNINADSNQLKQVFLNLFLNAIDAMPKGGKLKVSTARKDGKVSISVEDTGCGIPNESIPHLFDPFYTTKEGSTGMGLAVVHGIIKKHNGSITVESESGKGSKFVIKI